MSGVGFRPVRSLRSIAAICVLAAAGPAVAGEAEGPAASDAPATIELAGRWEGASYALGRKASNCDDNRCTLVLDLVKCQIGWCGVEVGPGARCGATALKLDGGNAGTGNVQFKGKLELAAGTEPYVVQVFLRTGAAAEDDKASLEIVGDTGGEFRLYRRSFPFNATLARTGDAKCRPDGAVSLLDLD